MEVEEGCAVFVGTPGKACLQPHRHDPRALDSLVGTWASVLIGSAVEHQVRRTFHDRIDAGQILVEVGADPERFATA